MAVVADKRQQLEQKLPVLRENKQAITRLIKNLLDEKLVKLVEITPDKQHKRRNSGHSETESTPTRASQRLRKTQESGLMDS